MKTYLISSEEVFHPFVTDMWCLDLNNFDQASLSRKLAIYHSLYYQLKYLNLYANTDFDRAFIPVLEKCFSDKKKYEGAFIFDEKLYDIQRRDVFSNFDLMDHMILLKHAKDHAVFQLDYDGKELLYLDYNDKVFHDILVRSGFEKVKQEDIKGDLKKGTALEIPKDLINQMVKASSIVDLEDWFNRRLQPVYDFLVAQGQDLNLKPNSFLSEGYFMYEGGKFYYYLLTNHFEGSACGEVDEGYACNVDLTGNLETRSLNNLLKQLSGVFYMIAPHLVDGYFFYGDKERQLFKKLSAVVKVESRFNINTFFYGGEGRIRFEEGMTLDAGSHPYTIEYGKERENLARISSEHLSASNREEHEDWTGDKVYRMGYVEEWYIEKAYREQLKADALAKLKEIKKQCKLIGLPYKLGEVFNECRLSKSR